MKAERHIVRKRLTTTRLWAHDNHRGGALVMLRTFRTPKINLLFHREYNFSAYTQMSYLTCLSTRVSLTGLMYALFNRPWFRSFLQTACNLLLVRLVFLYWTFQPGLQRASVNTDLVVTWNNLRPLHMLTLVTISYACVHNQPVLATAAAALDCILSAFLHNPLVY